MSAKVSCLVLSEPHANAPIAPLAPTGYGAPPPGVLQRKDPELLPPAHPKASSCHNDSCVGIEEAPHANP